MTICAQEDRFRSQKNYKSDHIFIKTCANENECTTYEKDGSQVPMYEDKRNQGYAVDYFVQCCEEDMSNSGDHEPCYCSSIYHNKHTKIKNGFTSATL